MEEALGFLYQAEHSEVFSDRDRNLFSKLIWNRVALVQKMLTPLYHEKEDEEMRKKNTTKV